MAKRDSRKTYEEIMRGAGQRRRELAQRALERERLYRASDKAGLTSARRSQSEALRWVIQRIEVELSKLTGELETVRGQEESVLLKAEIVHLRKLKARLTGRPDRKPPEAGLPVPAIPPVGPLPLQGGAAAPLEFGRD
jgi:hypothetical protein